MYTLLMSFLMTQSAMTPLLVLMQAAHSLLFFSIKSLCRIPFCSVSSYLKVYLSTPVCGRGACELKCSVAAQGRVPSRIGHTSIGYSSSTQIYRARSSTGYEPNHGFIFLEPLDKELDTSHHTVRWEGLRDMETSHSDIS